MNIMPVTYAQNLDSKLLNAINSNNETRIKSLLNLGANPNVKVNGTTILNAAINKQNGDIVDLLLNSGASPLLRGKNSGFPILLASIRCSSEIIELLLEAGANVNEMGPKNDHSPPLSMAILMNPWAGCGGIEMIEVLIDNGADINLRDFEGNTPLHHTALYGFTSATKYLINHGANLDTKNHNGKTAYERAIKNEKDIVAKILHDFATQKIEKDSSLLHTYGAGMFAAIIGALIPIVWGIVSIRRKKRTTQ